MTKIASARETLPAGLLAKFLLPFAIPILATFVLLLLVGDQWPRDIAVGSGLKLTGFCVAAITSFAVWWQAVRNVREARIRGFAAVLCGITGLMGWPVWSTGVLPSINGSMMTEPSQLRMTVERIEKTHKSKSRGFYHWAWLKTSNNHAVIQSGRYFISEDVYQALKTVAPTTVNVTVAEGLLGAYVVVGYQLTEVRSAPTF